jgi:hypothetical protein
MGRHIDSPIFRGQVSRSQGRKGPNRILRERFVPLRKHRVCLGICSRRAVKRPSGGSHDNVGFCNFWGRWLQQPIEYRSAASGGAPMRVRMYSVGQIVGLLVVPFSAAAAAAQTPVSPPVHAGPPPKRLFAPPGRAPGRGCRIKLCPSVRLAPPNPRCHEPGPPLRLPR